MLRSGPAPQRRLQNRPVPGTPPPFLYRSHLLSILHRVPKKYALMQGTLIGADIHGRAAEAGDGAAEVRTMKHTQHAHTPGPRFGIQSRLLL